MIKLSCARGSYDQTIMRSRRLWSNYHALEEVMIKLSCARGGYDQTIIRSRWLWSDYFALEVVLIRLLCARSRLWSHSSELEAASNKTKVRSNPPMIKFSRQMWPLIRPSPDLDCSALELTFLPYKLSMGTHECAFELVWSQLNLALNLDLGKRTNK